MPTVLDGGFADDTLNGGGGADDLYGGEGNDTLEGGEGNDYQVGGDGSDIYRFSAGFGSDEIWDSRQPGSTNVIAFDSTISPASVAVYHSRDGRNLILQAGATDTILIYDAYQYSDTGIDEVRFSDGTVWTAAQLITSAVPLPGLDITGDATPQFLNGSIDHDVINGGDGAETIDAGAGNDEVVAGAGDDVLNGGAGSDWLRGGAGSDTYQFSAGSGSDGVDLWDEGTSVADVIAFDATVAAGDVEISAIGQSIYDGILLKVQGSADTITLYNIEELDSIRFADNTVWSYQDIVAQMLPWQGVNLTGDQGTDVTGTAGWDRLEANDGIDSIISGLAGDDQLMGSFGDDSLTGGSGNDYLSGNGGSDTYHFSAGFGQDYLTEQNDEGDINHIVFDNSISAADIIIETTWR